MVRSRALGIVAAIGCMAVGAGPASAQRPPARGSAGALAPRQLAVPWAATGGAARPHAPQATPARRVGSVWKHLGIGLLAGAAVGAAVGIAADAGQEVTFPAVAFTVPAGALAGTVVGGVVWAVRRR